jgi:hypothetical protein
VKWETNQHYSTKYLYSLVVLLLLTRGFRLTALQFFLDSAVPLLAINVNICHFSTLNLFLVTYQQKHF